jgi:hypothetical protein
MIAPRPEPVTFATIGQYSDYLDTDTMPEKEREAFLRAVLGDRLYELGKEAR